MVPWTVFPLKGCARRLLGRLTLLLFAVAGVLVALAEWGVVPREALIVGTPAVIATLLVDTILYNEFLIRTGGGHWLILYTFPVIQSVIAATALTWLSRYWSQSKPRTSLNYPDLEADSQKPIL